MEAICPCVIQSYKTGILGRHGTEPSRTEDWAAYVKVKLSDTVLFA